MQVVRPVYFDVITYTSDKETVMSQDEIIYTMGMRMSMKVNNVVVIDRTTILISIIKTGLYA